MQYYQRSRKDTIIKYKKAKQAHADIVYSATQPKDAQHIGRDAGNVPRRTTLKQSVEAQDIEQSIN